MDVEKEVSLKNILVKVKDYAEKHTALTLGLATITFTAIAFIIQLCAYAYQIGYYGYFGVDKANILIGNETNTLLQIFYLISLAGIVTLINLVGYIFYRQRKFLKYFLSFVGIPYVMLMIIVLIIDGFNTFVQTAAPMLLMIFLVVLILNSMVIAYAMDASKADKIERINIKLYKLNSALNKNKKRIKKLEQQKTHLHNSKSNDKKIDNAKQRGKLPEFIKIGLLISMFGIYIALFSVLGWWIAMQNNKIFIVETDIGQSLTISNSKVNKYAIVYENDGTVVLTPCYEKEDELYIVKSCQITVDKKELLVIKHEFKRITTIEKEIKVLTLLND